MQRIVASVLLQLREDMDITREDIVRRCGVSSSTVRNAERGLKLKRRSALQILSAINYFLQEKQKPELKLEDLGLTVAS